MEKFYWDSNCFLGHLNDEEGKAERCAGVLERSERGEVLMVTSALTLAEVLWLRGKPRLPVEQAEVVKRFFLRSYIRVHNLSRKIAEAAQSYVWEHDIKAKDAIHVATAIHIGVDALETFDKKLIGKSGSIGTPLLLIRQPEESAQGRLDLG